MVEDEDYEEPTSEEEEVDVDDSDLKMNMI